jgi:hypothetical protein
MSKSRRRASVTPSLAYLSLTTTAMFPRLVSLAVLPAVAFAAITPPVVVQDADLSFLDDTKVPVSLVLHVVAKGPADALSPRLS